MADTPSGYLVLQRDDGFGDVVPLFAGQRYVAGRAPENPIVLRDDLCSRRHAELFLEGKDWSVRDLGSLNGTSVNDSPVKGTAVLRPRDAVRMGHTNFLFVTDLSQLPDIPPPTPPVFEKTEGIAITKRLAQTKYLQPIASVEETHSPKALKVTDRPQTAESLAVLYHLAFELADAQTPAELAQAVIAALLKGTPADVGAVLELAENKELEPLAYSTRTPGRTTYHKVSNFVGREVLASKQAILAEDVSSHASLRNRESLTDLRATSLICAPILAEDQALGLLHLYKTGGLPRLLSDDLEFALAAAKQLGQAWLRLKRQGGLSLENQVLRDQLRKDSELVGQSPELQKVEEQVARVAGTKATVLIRGESGVGKELVARAIHFGSPRKEAPFVCLNCAALTETLLESELFGHEKARFTGATERMIGKFEAADHGTIFLDEIGEMTANTQAKFLRVLEGQPFERVGGNTPIRTDVRVVAATNRPLEEAVRTGGFRKDLYFRLQVVQIDVPPLRDRTDDVPAIAEHFLKRYAKETGRKVKGFTPAALKKMQAYHWPGNVRELRNVVERAVALSAQPMLDEADVWLSPLDSAVTLEHSGEYEPVSLLEVEKQHILKTLEHTGGNKSKAAKILGIERSTLDRKLAGYGMK